MKHWMLAAALICFGSYARAQDVLLPPTAFLAIPQAMPTQLPTVSGTAGPKFDGVYFDTIIKDPRHPKMSTKLLYTSKFALDGGVTDIALVYHKGDPRDTLWPKKLLDMGVPPISWTLAEIGVGGNRNTAFVNGGLSVDVAPQLLSPLTNALKSAGGKAAQFSDILVSPDGSGLSLGLSWKTTVIANSSVQKVGDLRFPPRYTVGYIHQF